MTINVQFFGIKQLFKNYLYFINPLLNLKERDMEVLSSLLVFAYKYQSYDKKVFYSLLFSDEIKKYISKGLNITEEEFNESIDNMKKLKVICEDNTIDERILSFFKDEKDKFKIHIIFHEIKKQ